MNKCYLFAGLLFASADAYGVSVGMALDLNINGKRDVSKVDICGRISSNKKRSSSLKSVCAASKFNIMDGINNPDKNGNALLHFAIVKARNEFKKNKNSAKDSKQLGTDTNQKDENKCKNDSIPSEIKFLIECGADVNQKNKDGDFPSKIAFMCGETNIVKYLLEKGADINQQDKHGHTLLHLAALEDNEEMITYLVEHGADVNLENNCGQTPLHFSTQWSSSREAEEKVVIHKDTENMVKYLVNHGADVNKKDKNGQTSLSIAKQKNNERVIAYLLEQRKQSAHFSGNVKN